MPAFCTSTDPPYPSAPETSRPGLNAARRAGRATGSKMAAARPKRAKVSQAAGSHSRASFDSGTVVPQSTPAVVSAAKARRRSAVIAPWSAAQARSCSIWVLGKILFCDMAVELDDIDMELLTALQADADRTNVELARLVGLSPAATLHRVRWLKESGVIRIISATVDPAAVGFPLQMYVAATLGRHDPKSTRIFEDQVKALPQIISADNVAGEMDYILTVVARDVAELQEVLASLAARGGQRLITHLRLAELKPPSRLPLEAPGRAEARPARQRRRPPVPSAGQRPA
jgi:Lrp/AsnC family transcriptional regulator, leucine-responsive regulatory protein